MTKKISIYNPFREMLFEHDNGLKGFTVESCQPVLKIKRRYKKRPAMATVWVSTRSSFGMPVTHQTDPAVWAHEFTENVLAAIIKEVTGKCGLKYKLTRYHKVNGFCYLNKPTAAHFLTSLTEISGVHSNEGEPYWLTGDEYYEQFLVNGSSKRQKGCKQIVRYYNGYERCKPHRRKAQVYNSLPKDMKHLIRLRVIRLHLEGMKPGGYDTLRSNPSGISLVILDAFGVRIWGKTVQRIIGKYRAGEHDNNTYMQIVFPSTGTKMTNNVNNTGLVLEPDATPESKQVIDLMVQLMEDPEVDSVTFENTGPKNECGVVQVVATLKSGKKVIHGIGNQSCKICQFVLDFENGVV